MATIKVRLKKEQTLQDGSHPIVLQVIIDRKKRVVTIGHSCQAKYWNDKKHEPRTNHPNSTWLQGVITKKLNDANKALLELEASSEPYTLNDLANKLSKPKSRGMLFDFSENLISMFENAGHVGNAIVYKHLIAIYKTFTGEKDVLISSINFKTLKGFEVFLEQRGVKVNTISIYMRTLRAIINRAIKEGVCPESAYPFKDYKIRSESTRKRAISKADIDRIRDLELEGGSTLAFMRDIFMFSFYMRGMNLVDITYLKKENIKNGRIEYVRKKTGQKFSVKPTDLALQIINRYKSASPFIFPIIKRKGQEYQDYQNFKRLINKKLKDIGQMAGLEIPLTTYVTRHSWATIAKHAGITTAIISEGLGHESEETTQVYLDSFDSDVLDKANEVITG